MKQLFYLAFSILIVSMTSACKKSSDPTPASPANSTVTLHATDGNVYWNGNNETKQLAVKGQLTTKNLVITGTGFKLQVDTIAGIVGTYNLTPTDFNKFIEINTTADVYVSYNNSGQIVITSIDRVNQTVSGYFKLTMMSSTGATTFTGDFKNVFYPGKSSMTAVINGANWSAANPYYGVNNGQVNITGSNGFGGAPIFLNLENVTAPGTYEITLSGSYRAEYYTSNFIQYKATSGQVTVTEYNSISKVIKGTFSFTAPQVPDTGLGGTPGPATVTVTNGKFNIQTP
ncbi:hypothetical protein [Cytophaga hutchinsonii]|uniref:Lipoprotein n=1 Tax=Cytophaga hutchinsonii (strain ATCC 33406 / DSM 1761 / CIP 103989 / NBRC 15051 / NCIMB 9469 / D465) TaxID=269798 RepID=A0A6N4SRH4_CYTH3|nr:hypothetical protein [Cytophaga hutchinsonii]ABG58965.1 hypothetical protein CHU_1697 [Cytophaga hutchinsonii ATCC 33406]SFX82912.1 hypothetical protein SAMN04487930_110168 [Cytophaga hutchinsonii ATCC 33406]